MPKRKTLSERKEATRKALLEQAYQLFGSKGYADTSIDEIVVACNMTKGALYHHFKNKKDLFDAMLYQVELNMHEAMVEPKGETLREQLDNSIDIFFDFCADPAFRQIVLVDGPAVLGYERWKDTEIHGPIHQFHRLDQLLPSLIAGSVSDIYVKMVQSILIASTLEASKVIAVSDDPEEARQEAKEIIHRLIASFVGSTD